MIRIALVLVVSLLPILGCGKKEDGSPPKSLTERAAEKVTEKTLDAVEGVGNVLDKRGQKTAETVSRAAGEVLAGGTKGMESVAEKHGEQIGQSTAAAAGKVLDGASKEADKRAADRELKEKTATSESKGKYY